MAGEQMKCFVIMPFSKTNEKHTEEYWNRHYNDFLKPLIEINKSLKADRSAALRGNILGQIITDLVTAPIVVADLTDYNPNVFWELGVRQSFRHCTITIAEEGFIPPFDIGGKGVLFYLSSGDHIKHEQFHQKFLNAINDCLSNPEYPDSLVLEAITGRGTLYQVITKQESLRKLNAAIEENKLNIAMFGNCKEFCEKNATFRKAKQKNKIQMMSKRYSLRCLENLMVNRYAEGTASFYELISDGIRGMEAHIEMLGNWPAHPEQAEKWILADEKRLSSSLSKIDSKLVELVEEIASLM